MPGGDTSSKKGEGGLGGEGSTRAHASLSSAAAIAAKGKTPCHISDSESYRSVVRAVMVLLRFDRLGIALLTRQPYGTVSRIISEMSNEGYIEETGEKQVYDKYTVRTNPDLYYDGEEAGKNGKPRKRRKLIWPYGKKGGQYRFASSAVLWKTSKWAEFMVRWRCTI